MIWKFVFTFEVTLADDFAASQGHAGTAPSGGSVDFDVQRNGASIGTMSFADAATTATFTTVAATTEVFAIGDRIEIHTPSDLRSMADVSWSFDGTR
jgi:hypothetical protein